MEIERMKMRMRMFVKSKVSTSVKTYRAIYEAYANPAFLVFYVGVGEGSLVLLPYGRAG